MNRIVHLALKVENLEKATEFYKTVFGFQEVETKKTRDHISRHMTDGQLDFTLMKYDEGTRSAESLAAGEKPCIHHFAIEVDDVAGCTAGLKKYGCEIVSDPGVVPVKFRGPDGIIAELVPAERYKKKAKKTLSRDS
jgi:lactoylglutathione lyase